DLIRRYVRESAGVLDLGAGFGEFINHIRCREKWAVDADEQVRTLAASDVRVHCGPAHDLAWLGDASVDVVFASNFFEHVTTKDLLLVTPGAVRPAPPPTGRVLILQ